ncbi:MAG: LAGLIDADG family homing endonuclease [Promethearchaeota archaeon]
MVKRAFLRSYFGAEMSRPRLHTSSNKKFNQPLFKIAKIEGLSAEPFINDIKSLLKSFRVEISSIYRTDRNIRKDGRHTILYECNLASSDENLLNFFKYIGYEFAYKKEVLTRLACEYITTKMKAKEKAIFQLKKVLELKKQGFNYKQIAKKIGVSDLYLVESWCLNKPKKAGLPMGFPDFHEWQKLSTNGLKNGFIWDEIVTIEEIELPIAYDITTTDENHNFIAAGFLTRNCPPYNADFDGDEMNLHVPQGEEAQAEARILMRVQEQILTPRYGGPIIGGIQDYISAAFVLTRKSSLYTRDEVCNLLIAAGYLDDDTNERYNIPLPAIQYPEELWTGKQIISELLPEGINLSLKAKLCRKCDECKKEECPNDAYVLIRNGKLLYGIIDKKAIGAGQPESLLHRIVKDYGAKKGRQFLDSVARMLIEVITNIGFTIGLDDVEIQEEAENRIVYILKNANEEVNKLVEVYKRAELQRLPGRTLLETLEMRIMEKLSEGRDEAGRIAGEYLGLNKHIVIMTKTGARGNPLNLAQMIACVGQQSVRGERILRGYRKRALPHFLRDDLSASARGFVTASYYTGLNPIEFFFHAMGGREGLVDTAVRTSTSGYMQRRLINALQDIKVEYDGTVRNAVGNVIQFKYGEDRIDPAKSDHGKAVNIDVILEKVISEIDYQGPSINSEDIEIQDQLEDLLKTDRLPKSIIEKISIKLESIEIDEIQFNALIEGILKSYHNALIEPGEAVGVISAQSIGEPGTQMSLDHNERIIIRKGRKSDIIAIGDFVDDLIAQSELFKFQDLPQSTIYDLPEGSEFFVPTLGNDEKIHWRKLKQVSRHPPNGDLLKISTRSGRSITTTLSHSFVIRKENRIIPQKGNKLKIGDRIPLIQLLPSNGELNRIHLNFFLSPSEVLYGSELQKAMESMNKLGKLWKEDFNKSYTVPLTASSLYNILKSESAKRFMPGFVYPKTYDEGSVKIPEELELDFPTGWIIGAYLAEGTNDGRHLIISNIDVTYHKRIVNFSESLEIGYNIREYEGEYGKSKSVQLNSKIFAMLLERMCGKGVNNKKVPSWALNAPESFIRGLLRAYFDGDGSFSVEQAQIRASSNSLELRDGICLLLSRFGIYTSKYTDKDQYNLRIPGKYAPRFRDLIGSDIQHKSETLSRLAELELIKESEDQVTYDIIDMIPGFGSIFKDIRSKLQISKVWRQLYK